jgi:hypothetical protein
MFWSKKLKISPDMIKMIKPTSKSTAKMQCLFACKGNIEEAEKLYDFLTKDMPNLPDFDPVAPSNMQQVKETALGLFGWFKENQDEVLTVVDFIKNMRKGGGGMPPSAPPSAPLPPIN